MLTISFIRITLLIFYYRLYSNLNAIALRLSLAAITVQSSQLRSRPNYVQFKSISPQETDPFLWDLRPSNGYCNQYRSQRLDEKGTPTAPKC